MRVAAHYTHTLTLTLRTHRHQRASSTHTHNQTDTDTDTEVVIDGQRHTSCPRALRPLQREFHQNAAMEHFARHEAQQEQRHEALVREHKAKEEEHRRLLSETEGRWESEASELREQLERAKACAQMLCRDVGAVESGMRAGRWWRLRA